MSTLTVEFKFVEAKVGYIVRYADFAVSCVCHGIYGV